MARLARGEYLDPNTIQIVHSIQRCVRRAFLCGNDTATGMSYEHRRTWIRDRLEFLASIFAIDCLTYSVMSNHYHIVLRNRPDIVRGWSDEQVARRWLQLHPMRKNFDGRPSEPTEAELNSICNDPLRVAELRIRLSDISWWMRSVSEPIARAANREDKCTGRFWEGRYKCQLLLDEPSLLACAVYVDLNPIRAALARTPEQSKFTGAKDRIDDLCQLAKSETKGKKRPVQEKTSPGFMRPKRSPASIRRWERSRRRTHSGWMSPLQIDERNDPVGTDASSCGHRASLKGFLSMPLTSYLQLLDWTGRQVKSNKRGIIPPELAPILVRIGIDSKSWCNLVKQFGRLFKRAIGTPESLAEEATRRGQSCMHAPGSRSLALE